VATIRVTIWRADITPTGDKRRRARVDDHQFLDTEIAHESAGPRQSFVSRSTQTRFPS
jgi:hypothetical protein